MPFPTTLNSHKLSLYNACGTKFSLTHVWGLRDTWEKTLPLFFGDLFAVSMQFYREKVWVDKLSPEEAMQLTDENAFRLWLIKGNYPLELVGQNKNRSFFNLMVAFRAYEAAWPVLDYPPMTWAFSGDKGIETPIVYPLPIKHPDFDQPILWSVRPDFVSGAYIIDDKTTGDPRNAVKNHWALDNQILGYYWIYKASGFNMEGVKVRIISLYGEKWIPHTVEVCPSEGLLNRWLDNTIRLVEKMVEEYKADKFFSAHNTLCAGCEKNPICFAPDFALWRRELSSVTGLETTGDIDAYLERAKESLDNSPGKRNYIVASEGKEQ